MSITTTTESSPTNVMSIAVAHDSDLTIQLTPNEDFQLFSSPLSTQTSKVQFRGKDSSYLELDDSGAVALHAPAKKIAMFLHEMFVMLTQASYSPGKGALTVKVIVGDHQLIIESPTAISWTGHNQELIDELNEALKVCHKLEVMR